VEVKNIRKNLTSEKQIAPYIPEKPKEEKIMSLSNLKELRANRKETKSL